MGLIIAFFFFAGIDLSHGGHIAWIVVSAITGIIIVAVVAYIFLQKKGHLLRSIPDKIMSFENPLLYSTLMSKPGRTELNKIIENEEKENTDNALVSI